MTHPRLGNAVLEREGHGEVREWVNKFGTTVFFAWPEGSTAGSPCVSLKDAAKLIGLVQPVGCSDFDGRVRRGRMIERHADGEIWKDGFNYFVWFNDKRETLNFGTLTKARDALAVNIQHNTTPTPPKSSYAQNRPGYSAHRT